MKEQSENGLPIKFWSLFWVGCQTIKKKYQEKYGFPKFGRKFDSGKLRHIFCWQS